MTMVEYLDSCNTPIVIVFGIYWHEFLFLCFRGKKTIMQQFVDYF